MEAGVTPIATAATIAAPAAGRPIRAVIIETFVPATTTLATSKNFAMADGSSVMAMLETRFPLRKRDRAKPSAARSRLSGRSNQWDRLDNLTRLWLKCPEQKRQLTALLDQRPGDTGRQALT